jgi:ribA/ribD-fused uncharacterized protein
MTIAEFRGDYAFLSNFYPAKVGMGTELYPTVEHAYQASKTYSLDWQEKIRNAATPGIAKRMGKNVPLRSDWMEIRQRVMWDLLVQKFDFLHPLKLYRQLLDTAPHELLEGNTWGDRYWGMTLNANGKWVGNNVLGGQLMDLRVELYESIRAQHRHLQNSL